MCACTEGPTHAVLEALRLYGEGYRPTSNKYRHAAKPGTGKTRRYGLDYSRRMNREQIALNVDVFGELKKLCKKHGE